MLTSAQLSQLLDQTRKIAEEVGTFIEKERLHFSMDRVTNCVASGSVSTQAAKLRWLSLHAWLFCRAMDDTCCTVLQ